MLIAIPAKAGTLPALDLPGVSRFLAVRISFSLRPGFTFHTSIAAHSSPCVVISRCGRLNREGRESG